MAGRPVARRRPRAADIAGLRAQRARPRRDRRPRRRPRRVARRVGARPRGERPGAAPGDTSARTTSRRSHGRSRPGRGSAWTRCSPSCSSSATRPSSRSPARGEFARRGGIVDVFPPSAALPIRIEFFGDEIDSLRAFDPTDQRSVGTVRDLTLLPATEFLLPPGGADEIRSRLGRLASKLPERLALDLARFAGDADPERPDARDRRPRARRRRRGGGLGAGSSRRRPASTTSAPGTLLVLDEPGDLADAAAFLWRQADERHAELVEQGELPRDWPTGVPARDRLEAAPPRRADAGADLAVRGGRRAGHGVRIEEPDLGRPVRLARAGPAARPDGAARRRRRALARREGPRRARQRPGAAARGAARRGGPSGRDRVADRGAAAARRDRARRPQPQRRVRGRAGRASRSSPTASCSAASASGGPRRCAGSCRATSSSG